MQRYSTTRPCRYCHAQSRPTVSAQRQHDLHTHRLSWMRTRLHCIPEVLRSPNLVASRTQAWSQQLSMFVFSCSRSRHRRRCFRMVHWWFRVAKEGSPVRGSERHARWCALFMSVSPFRRPTFVRRTWHKHRLIELIQKHVRHARIVFATHVSRPVVDWKRRRRRCAC